MLHTTAKKTIRVMFTPFRDGLQSCFGGRVRVKDVLPAMEASARAGIRHFEFGGGARFQAPYFYVGESPFDCMDQMRAAVGNDVPLQILTRSVSGVTLTSQGLKALSLQARLMKKHGTTWDRNFDFMNDVENLARTGKPIVDSGMHHQVCIALMGLPFASDKVHTPEFYIDVMRRFLKTGVPFDSVCLKDASGTTDPRTCYETIKGLRKLLGPDVLIWQHTHDTASMGIACYMAGVEGGADGIDLSLRPLASGTVQPDIRAMAHALKGTGYSLDVDATKLSEVEKLLEEGLSAYDFNPVTTTCDARVVGFPMPGGAIGPNVHMMQSAGILNRYDEVLAEFPEVVRAGGAWTSVTPGSQQYWLQAFNNVLHGRWKKIDAGFGNSVLGYFGRPPIDPDPAVVKAACEQLKKEPFTGDPLGAAPDTVALAEKEIQKRNLPMTEENVFLVAAAAIPGKDMELNEGIRLLDGRAKISLPFKKTETDKSNTAPAAPTEAFKTKVTVDEGGRSRSFLVTIAPRRTESSSATNRAGTSKGRAVPVYSPFEGKVEVVEIKVRTGDSVKKGQVLAAVEAMKAKHDVKSPCTGSVRSVDTAIGSEVSKGISILTLEEA
jgi:pyruvate carboxylase subunit B